MLGRWVALRRLDMPQGQRGRERPRRARVPATLEAVDGTAFGMFMPGRLRDPEQHLKPVPWNLPGVREQLPDVSDVEPAR